VSFFEEELPNKKNVINSVVTHTAGKNPTELASLSESAVPGEGIYSL